MKEFSLKLLAADKAFFDGKCSSLIVPSSDGQYGILANHSDVVIAVVPGIAQYVANDERVYVFVSSGIAKVEKGNVLMLVESCENAKDTSEDWAEDELEEAKDELSRKESRFNVLNAEVKIARSLNRVKEKEHLN